MKDILSGLLEDLRAEGDQLDGILAGLSAEQWRTSTPAAGEQPPRMIRIANRPVARRPGPHPAIAYVEGDDLAPGSAELGPGDALTADTFLGDLGNAEVLL